MAAPAKLLHVLAFLAKEESSYATPVSLTTTADGVQLQYQDKNVGAPFTIGYDFDGDLGPSVGNLGTVVRVGPSGRAVTGPLPHRARPGGAAYSATVVPSVHRMLKTAGFDATLTTTSGTEKWVYTPTAPGSVGTSATSELYTRGEKWPVAGLLSDLAIDFSNPAPPIWTFKTSSILTALPTDVAAPAVTYPLQNVAPPLASSIALTLGNLTSANATVMSGGFALNREITPRVALSASGAHLGFVPGGRKPDLKVVLEATALTGAAGTAASTFDPYNLRDLALSLAVVLQFGSVQYFRYKLSMGQMQVIDAVPGNNGPVATVELTLRAANSTAIAADDISITFD